MAKVSKHKEILDQLYDMVTKEAAEAKPKATGVPGGDVKAVSVDEKHENHDKNEVKPENNTPQVGEQKPSTDPAKPVAKAAEEKVEVKPEEVTPTNSNVEKLGKEILELIGKFANSPAVSGVPGGDVKAVSVGEQHESHDKNQVKPENNTPQVGEQKPSTDPAKPLAKASEDVDVDKVASYELGKLWAELLLKQAQEQELNQIKEAGRRDFEAMIAQAAEELQNANKKQATVKKPVENTEAIKQAEELGAQAFRELYKKAQEENETNKVAEQLKALEAKLASLEDEKNRISKEAAEKVAAKEAELNRFIAEQKEAEKMARWTEVITSNVINSLKQEFVNSK